MVDQDGHQPAARFHVGAVVVVEEQDRAHEEPLGRGDRLILEQGQLYGPVNRPLVMSADESIDIDEPRDLEYAEWLLLKRRTGLRRAG